jgi:hypothetical protein
MMGTARDAFAHPTIQATSVGYFDLVELAPFAQGSLDGPGFEIVPALEYISFRQECLKLLIGTPLVEEISHLIEVFR